MATPSLPELKKFLDITVADFDDELPLYLDSGTSTIAHRCGPLEPTSYTETTSANYGSVLVSHWPLVSVESVVDDDGNSVDVTNAKINQDAGIVRVGAVDGPVVITYTAGYDPCPADLETAVYVVAGHLWDTQRGRSGSFTQIHGLDDDAPVGGDASFFVMQGFALPRRAMELTRPYVKAGFR